MSRDGGFGIADVATDLFHDDKVNDLWHTLHHDEAQMSRALNLYVAVLLASWRHGCRKPLTESLPLWLSPEPALVSALMAVKLLDRTQRITAKSWRIWFGPAKNRRDARRDAGRIGGIASGRARLERQQTSTETKQPLSVAEPVRPSVRTDRPSDRTVRPAREETRSSDEYSAEVDRRILARQGMAS